MVAMTVIPTPLAEVVSLRQWGTGGLALLSPGPPVCPGNARSGQQRAQGSHSLPSYLQPKPRKARRTKILGPGKNGVLGTEPWSQLACKNLIF